jgi:hypothetical protein
MIAAGSKKGIFTNHNPVLDKCTDWKSAFQCSQAHESSGSRQAAKRHPKATT